MTEEEEPRQGSGCAAVTVILVFTAVPLGLVYLASRDAFIVLVAATAWGGILWAARSRGRWVYDEPNPSPTAPPEPSPDTNPQVRIVKDPDHSSRWEVVVDQGKQGRSGQEEDDQVRDADGRRDLLRRLRRRR